MSAGQPPQTARKWLRRGAVAAISLCLCYVGLKLYGRWLYPYGGSHSCDKILLFLLQQYADANDGNFPSGEASPEASLSLLARPPYDADAEILRGKTAPKDVVETILAKGELLSPETCGWHYVEGLRSDDDTRIAIFWDKAGLGHNGERMPNGNRKITRISWANETIPGFQWDAFLNEQKSLLEKLPEDRRRLAMRNFPR